MTVAAVVLAARPEGAIADADGVPSARRIADTAWAGGATPIVVVSFDPDGRVAKALGGAPATLAEPAPVDRGPVGQMQRGIEVAGDVIRETTAAILWPARMAWVGAETVTALIETHGVEPDVLLRPTFDGEPGWPVLLPIAHAGRLTAIRPERMPEDVLRDLASSAPTVPTRELELGDPGVVFDSSTPRADLPAYVGPPVPPAAHVHEWGAALAEESEDAPLEGPALAPYGQAIASDPDQPG